LSIFWPFLGMSWSSSSINSAKLGHCKCRISGFFESWWSASVGAQQTRVWRATYSACIRVLEGVVFGSRTSLGFGSSFSFCGRFACRSTSCSGSFGGLRVARCRGNESVDIGLRHCFAFGWHL
jgi:hypothetical protein